MGIVHSLRLIDVPGHLREVSREMKEDKVRVDGGYVEGTSYPVFIFCSCLIF